MQATVVFEKNWGAINAKDERGNRLYRYIINEGSSRSSKTISLIDCYDLYARANENKRLTVWRDTKTDCKKTVLKDAEKHLRKTGRYLINQEYNKTESIFHYSDGSTFEIHGTDDEETVHGLEQDAAWFNEPYKISKDTFDQIDQRTSDFIFIDWNPKKAHWIEDLKKDPRTLVIHSTFKDNPFCPPEQKLKILSYQPVKFCDVVVRKLIQEQEAKEYDLIKNHLSFTEKQIKELARCRENEEKKSANDFNWQVYGLGHKAERAHRIFKWEKITLEEYRKIEATIYYGTDWGKSDAWGIVEAKYYDNALYLRELNYTSENEWRGKLSVTELSQINSDNEGIVTWLFRKLGISQNNVVVCDNNRPMKIATLRRAGYQAMPATKGPGSIIDGIDILHNLTVYYTDDSENLEFEQENYSYLVDRYGVVLDEPEDANNHIIDPTRYIASYLQSRGVIKRV